MFATLSSYVLHTSHSNLQFLLVKLIFDFFQYFSLQDEVMCVTPFHHAQSEAEETSMNLSAAAVKLKLPMLPKTRAMKQAPLHP